ncbi:hypothetical protein P6709_06135 [Jeotgalibacillus sp. ET6]|uniref:hypothetical protein n=1 Tax=Jeotgalibacillus sp. ET6 TaxID=3037260 RepID=UPI0024185FB9|nr:hypothetical protein [Jeotgalibacillus sp. ET6]MDG5471319.1 hypothetical protein [Jeotgalibacillus sp. ET6]
MKTAVEKDKKVKGISTCQLILILFVFISMTMKLLSYTDELKEPEWFKMIVFLPAAALLFLGAALAEKLIKRYRPTDKLITGIFLVYLFVYFYLVFS